MNHLKQIGSRLAQYGLDAMLITNAPGEFYAVGFHGEGVAVVTAEAYYYFTDSRYIEAAEAQVEGAALAMTDRDHSYKDLVLGVVERHGIQNLGFEEAYLSVAGYQNWSKALPCQLRPAQKLMWELRAAKDQDEIALMERAQEITDQAFGAILEFIRPGMTEREIAARLQYEMLCLGAEKMSFDPIVVTGPNGSLPHGVPGQRRVEPGSFITMDFGCIRGGYCSDMTRTVAVGQPTPEMERVYHTVLEAQLAGIAAARGGISGKELDWAARQVIEKAGYGPYFGHSYGHSLGIEIHESPNAAPRAEEPLPVGAVISAEPGIYLPGRFGVRIEDVTILTPNGCIDITKSPKELIIL